MDEQFAQDIAQGLSATQKYIPCQYFYDERGSWLFQQIMQLPEYYLTACETDVLEKQGAALLQIFWAEGKGFNLIDLGAGDATKTKALLSNYVQQQVKFTYTPVDLSTSILSALSESLDAVYEEQLNYQAINADYWEAMEQIKATSDSAIRKVVLFLGANIGNFTPEESINFLTKLKTYLNKGDLVLMGFDLKKRPEIIYKAYLDTKGTTAAFNLNLLHRINRELGGNFKPNYFRYYPSYNAQTGILSSHLVAQKEQTVSIKQLNMEVKFEQWEAIHTEIAVKHSPTDIEQLATTAGYQIREYLTDSKAYFVDVLLEV
ncbi:MAG: L-histidine N(alpha)-methyltransferase [Aureispira sp.]